MYPAQVISSGRKQKKNEFYYLKMYPTHVVSSQPPFPPHPNKVRWGNVFDKIWKDLGGDQEEVLSMEKFGGYKTKSRVKNRRKGEASAKK